MFEPRIEEKAFKMTVYFRIHWLPLGFTKQAVFECLDDEADFLEVLEIENERWQSSNGIILNTKWYNKSQI